MHPFLRFSIPNHQTIIFNFQLKKEVNVGDKAPEILGLNEKGEEIRLSDYK